MDRLKVRKDLATPPEPFRYRLFHEASIPETFVSRTRLDASQAWISPVQGAVTSAFGKVRYFNGHHRGYHLGVDLRGSTGTEVAAPARGKVIQISKEYLGGLTLRVDHGSGWVSHFMHLKEVQSSLGQVVQAGDTLALVGASGRVTGPHLHWAVTWNGRFVDPIQFLSEESR